MRPARLRLAAIVAGGAVLGVRHPRTVAPVAVKPQAAVAPAADWLEGD
jgi:hypothetical protein